MVHRGPDDSGDWTDAAGGCGLGHRRLSIIDLSPDGRQPMSGVGVDTVVTYNGEIYNFAEIRDRLITQGVAFRSRSDTEILPHLFKDLDPTALSRLSGMFAFGVWSPSKRELLLARDGFGKKPLYIYQDDRFFAFSSEIQAFYALPGFDAGIDRDALAEYLLLGYLPGPRTIYARVRQLEPGSFERLSFENGVRTLDSGRFFRFSAIERRSISGIDPRALKDRLKTRLIQAVEQRMVSDVPLGAFLSGGVDSSLVVAIVRRELQKEIDTFSIGFEGSADSEHEDARAIAAHLGATHHDSMVKPDGVSLIRGVASALDQPNGDSSCLPTYLLCEFARRSVTVALSGDGGDELFGGYGRYRDTMNELADPDLLRRVHGRDPKTAQPSDLYMSLRWHIWLPEQASALMGGLPADAAARVAEWRGLMNDPATPVMHRMRTLDANIYMPGAVLAKVDRMSMQHALEVRCPLLDLEFAEMAMGLSEDDCWAPPAATKRILKEIATEYMPNDWMQRPKKGFGLPANAWAMDDVIRLCRETLTTSDSRLRDHVDGRALAETVERQSKPGQFSIYQMWPLLILELWMREQPSRIAALAHDVRQAA
jgi:asparagine synthase (glutamine-hydrolysing)